METTSLIGNHQEHFDMGALFDENLHHIHANVGTLLADGSALFTTHLDPRDLWKFYLDRLGVHGGEEVKAQFTCGTCRATVEKLANLCTIAENGNIIPLLWSPLAGDSPLGKAHRDLHDRFITAKITGLWISPTKRVGVEHTSTMNGPTWNHLYIDLPDRLVEQPSDAKTAYQRMAQSKERFRILMNGDTGIHQYSLEVYRTAMRLLENAELHRSEHFFASAQFHFRVKENIEHNDLRNARSLLWRDLMSKPVGWENVNSTMVGTLYEWIKMGFSLDRIKTMWNTRVRGDNFQRPKAAPSAATIAQAEALVEKMGIAKSLERRYARLEDVRCMWKPKVTEESPVKTAGVFGSLIPKNATPAPAELYQLSEKKITWEKFEASVLPIADKMEFLIPPIGSFAGLLTATHEEAPPIIRWDSWEDRYPVSGYTYVNPSHSSQWSLTTGVFVPINGITKLPGVEGAHMFILEGCKDRGDPQGLCLFPEILKSDLHEIRSVIEAFSNGGERTGVEDATACGYQISKGSIGAVVRVTTNQGTRDYLIDRFD